VPLQNCLRFVALAAAGLILSAVSPIPVSAQQNSDLVPLLEELLERLPGKETDASQGDLPDDDDEVSEEATAAVESVIPAPEPNLSGRAGAPAVATTILPPATGPEADLARQLLAITDTEENQSEVREDLAADFVRRLSGRLDPQDSEVEAVPTESATVLAADQSGIPDGEELIFEVRIENRRFLQSLFGIKQGDGIFVDLAETSELLEFAVEVDDVNGTATGFFISPEKTFELDLNAGTVAIEGEAISVGAEDVRRLDDAILVHSDTFAIWFNVRLDVDFRNLAVNVISEAPIPLQQRFERQQRIASLRRGRRGDPTLPPVDDPYRLIDWPFSDVRLQSSLLDTPGQKLRTTQSYSVVGRGDLGLATGEFFFSGNRDDLFNSARLTLRREDPTGGLLGPLQATRVEAGDVVAPGLPVGGPGVGAFVTNNTTGIQNLGSSTDFAGLEQPGTDVELYRNGILLDLQTVGDDGRYEFRDVPLVLGDNEFRLVFYGTLGEIREERASRTVTSVGKLTNLPTYSAAVFKPGDPLIPLEPTTAERGPVASAVTAARSFSNGISASAGLSFVDTANPSTGSLDAGVSGPLLGGVASLDGTTTFDGGWDATGTFRTQYRGQSIGLRLATNQGQTNNDSDAFIVSASGAVPIVGKATLPYSTTIGRTISDDGTVSDTASLSNSTGLGRFRLSNSLEWARLDPPTAPEQRSLTGTLTNSVFFFPLNFRLGAAYRIIETRQLQRVDGDINWTINNRSQARFGYQRFLLSQREAYSLGGSYRFDRFILSPTLTYDSNDHFFALLNISFAAGREPISGRIRTAGSTFTGGGAVAARVYRDENLNRQLDPGEELLEDVRVEAVHANKSEDTNEDGIAFLQRLPAYLPTDVRVRPGSLPDPFLAPLDPGRSVLPRPGRTNVIDFPVALTTEIEGAVLALRREGDEELAPLPGVTVELRNEEGAVVASEQTLFDGFFLFVNVFPGTYTLHLGPENVTSQGLVVPAPRRIPVPISAEPILGVEIITGPPGVDLPPPGDAKIAAVRLGRSPTIESARASQALYLGLFPDLLEGLALERPIQEQNSPYELTFGRVTQGRAANICKNLKTAKVSCEVVTFPFVAEASALLSVPTATERVPGLPTLQAPESTNASAAPVTLDLGRYPSADRAGVAWSLLRRLYATELDGADRQRGSSDDTILRVSPLPSARAEALCAQLGDSVPRCEVQPIPADTPMAEAAPTSPPVLPGLRPVEPVVAAAPVPVVEDAPLPPITEPAQAPSELSNEVDAEETVVAIRLGEYGSQTGVDAGWQLMRRLYPKVLESARPLQSAQPVTDRRPLLVGPFTEINALSVCARLIADGQACRVTRARL
jgi:hypothetical protein